MLRNILVPVDGSAPSRRAIRHATTLARKLKARIVMASHGRRGLERLLLGCVTRAMLAKSPVPVMICQ